MTEQQTNQVHPLVEIKAGIVLMKAGLAESQPPGGWGGPANTNVRWDVLTLLWMLNEVMNMGMEDQFMNHVTEFFAKLPDRPDGIVTAKLKRT